MTGRFGGNPGNAADQQMERPARHGYPSFGPGLVLVSGTHGSGKSTLSSLLSDRLDVPLVSRDRIRRAMRPTAPVEPGDPASLDAGRRSVAAFFAVLQELVSRGVSVVADQPFRRGISEDDVRRLTAARVGIVHCQVPREVAIERCRQRGSIEVADMLEVRDEARWARVEEPLDLDVPLLQVSTLDGYDPSLERIVEFCRNITG